jgi:hydroxymethylglutaryl-CoA lyase
MDTIDTMERLPASAVVCEVGPRDGFQMEKEFIPTARKVELIDALARTGLTEIQATSFVHPKAIPQLADAEAVLGSISRVPGVRYTALVPNEKGAGRAIEAEADGVDVVVSISESHCLSNTNMTPEQAMERAANVARMGEDADVEVTIGFATALGCPFEGVPPYSRVEQFVGRAVEELGVRSISVADTVGMASPLLVYSTLRRLRERFPQATFTLHLHNTRNMGSANLLAGLQAGVTRFDTSIAGLGGCPYAPGATGNVATEDVVNMLREMDIETGVRLDEVVEVAARAREVIGHADSGVLQAGTSRQLLGKFEGSQAKTG